MRMHPVLRVESDFLCASPLGKLTPYAYAITKGVVGRSGAVMARSATKIILTYSHDERKFSSAPI